MFEEIFNDFPYILRDVSWLVVLVGTLASYLVGWLWYLPRVWGRRWAQGLGINMETPPPMFAMILMLFGYFLLNIFINILVFTESLAYLVFAGAAFIFMGYSGETFAGHPRSVRLINAGCVVAVLFFAANTHYGLEYLWASS